jgi:hypothetical protein
MFTMNGDTQLVSLLATKLEVPPAAPPWKWLGGWVLPGVVAPFMTQEDVEGFRISAK